MPKRDEAFDQSIFHFSDRDYLTLRDLVEGALVPGEVGARKTRPNPPPIPARSSLRATSRRRNRAKAR